jgi:hypothetical protein
MRRYLLLRNPGHNRVYYLESEKLALAELTLTSKRFDQPCDHIESINIAGINYLSFTVGQILSETDLKWLSNLSFVLALYQQSADTTDSALHPVELTPHSHVDPKISMLLKYSGKTNEIFTRMMVNVGLVSSDFGLDDAIQLLDPVSGKGTTLFEGAIRGFDVTGIESERKMVHEATIFFKKFLEQEKYKHSLSKHAMYSSSTGSEASIQLFEYARDKQEYIWPSSPAMPSTPGVTSRPKNSISSSVIYPMVSPMEIKARRSITHSLAARLNSWKPVCLNFTRY